MTNIIAQPLGYGQDNIKDPLDKTPYTYRVNQLQDKAQFLSYLENSRFQRTLTIAGYTPLIDTAHALEVDTSLFQDRYPYTTGDILGILIDKESNAPMQSSILNNNSNNNNNNNNSNTGSLTLTPDSDTTYTLLLTEETTLSSLSSGSLTLMKDGLLQKKTLESIAGGAGDTNNNSNNNGGNNNSNTNGHILTIGQYDVMGQTYYGYIGPQTIALYSSYGINITTITPGSLESDEVEGETIDAMITTASFSSWDIILVASPSTPDTVAYTSSQGSMSCSSLGNIGTLTVYDCTGTLLPNTVTTGSQHELEITVEAVTPTLITIPTFSSSTAMDSQIQMSWTSIENALSYTLAYSENSGDFIEITGLTSTGYTHSGLQNEALYAYKIKAVFAHGDGEYSGYMYDRPGFPPSIPTNFSANGIGGNSIRLTWDAPPDGQGGFDIEYSTNATDFLSVGSLSGGGGVRMYVHNGLTEGVTYHYRIRANKSNWDPGLWSDVVSTIAIGAPLLGTPGNVTDAPINTDIISNTFTASDISTPVPLTVSGAEFRVNGGSWVTSANINNGDQVEYKTVVTQDGERKVAQINFNGNGSQWIVDAYSCFSFSNGTITNYSNSCTKDVVIPSKIWNQDVTSIGNNAFAGKLMTSVVMPDSILAIGNSAFAYSQLTSVNIPSSVVFIDSSAFRNNQITSVTIGNNVASIGDWAFGGNQLTSVVIPDGVVTIGDAAFNFNLITSVTIGNNVASIGDGAFANNQLTSVVIPDGVVTIGDGAFANNQLTSVVIPDGVVTIGDDAFRNNQLTSVVIPDGVVMIGAEAFRNNQLTSVVIPESVTTIYTMAFADNHLTSVTIPNSIVNLSTRIFEYNNLTSVVIPDGVVTIGAEAFSHNKLASLTIPASVTNIGFWAFYNQNTSLGNGTIYGPSSGYVKNTYINNGNNEFDKAKLPNYVDQ